MPSDRYTGYSGKQASKKDEADYKQYTKTKEESVTTTAEPKKASLQKALEGKGVSFVPFSLAGEHYRKRVLKEDYEAFKLKYGWIYDQPIEE